MGVWCGKNGPVAVLRGHIARHLRLLGHDHEPAESIYAAGRGTDVDSAPGRQDSAVCIVDIEL